MSGTASSVLFWATATSVTALGIAWTSPAATRLVRDVLLVAWLVLSNVR